MDISCLGEYVHVVFARILSYILPRSILVFVFLSTTILTFSLLFFYYRSLTCHHYRFFYVAILQLGVSLFFFVEL